MRVLGPIELCGKSLQNASAISLRSHRLTLYSVHLYGRWDTQLWGTRKFLTPVLDQGSATFLEPIVNFKCRQHSAVGNSPYSPGREIGEVSRWRIRGMPEGAPLRSWKILESSNWIRAIWWIILGEIHVITNLYISFKNVFIPSLFHLLSLLSFLFSALLLPFPFFFFFSSPFLLSPSFLSLFSLHFPLPFSSPSRFLVSEGTVYPNPYPHWLRLWHSAFRHILQTF